MTLVTWILVGIILISIAVFTVVNQKKRWEKVTMADGDMMCLYRTSGDYWFRDRQNMTTFHRVNGAYVKLSNHFTLKREEITEDQVAGIEAEILRMREKVEKEEAIA